MELLLTAVANVIFVYICACLFTKRTKFLPFKCNEQATENAKHSFSTVFMSPQKQYYWSIKGEKLKRDQDYNNTKTKLTDIILLNWCNTWMYDIVF